MPAKPGDVAIPPPVVWIFARKLLKINTRIFKEASSLTAAGYRVTIFGITGGQLPSLEQKDGYTIHRIPPLRLQISMRNLPRVKQKKAPTPGQPPSKKLLPIRITNHTLMLLIRTFHWPLMALNYHIRAYRLAMSLPERPVVIHANDLDALGAAIAASKRTGARLIYDAQEFYTGIHTLPWWWKTVLSIYEFFAIRIPDRTIMVNPEIAKRTECKYYITTSTTILNCPPYQASFDGHATARTLLNLPPDTPIYLYSGALSPQRGIENVLASLHYLPGHLAILGDGPLKDDLIAIAQHTNLSDRLHFLDWVPHTDVPSIIHSADVAVLPYLNAGINHYLCSPSKLFHYIMAEVPIACSDFPFLRSVVHAYHLGGTFDPSDPLSIADTIAYCHRNREEIKANLRAAKAHYCWEVEEAKLLSLYRELA